MSLDGIGNSGNREILLATKPIGYDQVTNVQNMMDYNHHKIHAGRHFFVVGFETLADNASKIFTVTPPATGRKVHMEFDIQSTTQLEMYICEGSSYDVASGGAAITPNNNNRNSSFTSVSCLRNDPVIVDSGTCLFSFSSGLDGATPSKSSFTGALDRSKEIILEAGKQTMFMFVSRGADNIVSYSGNWYEHEDVS